MWSILETSKYISTISKASFASEKSAFCSMALVVISVFHDGKYSFYDLITWTIYVVKEDPKLNKEDKRSFLKER